MASKRNPKFKKFLPLDRFHNPLKIKDNIKDLRQLAHKKRKHLTRENVLRWFIRGSIASVVIVILLFAWYAKDLPTPQGIRRNLDTEETSKIFDRTGEHLLYAVSGQQRRISIPLSEMPDDLKNAVISLEDKNFYKHKGLDFRGIARSLYYDIVRRTNRYGGSTITQQLAKNAIIQSNRKHFDRKIREAILSIEIEAMYSKDKILELYLNEIPFGGSTYGVEAAAQTYFGKKAKDLTLEESATLAAMIQRPSYLSPYGTHTDELIYRRNLAIDNMKNLGHITAKEAEAAKEKKLTVVPRRDTILAPHFVMYVRDLIAEKYGEEIFNEGISIITTLDIEQQKAAEAAVAEGAAANRDRYGIENAALVSLNPKTGEVLSMVGSADYFNSEIGGQFNVITAKRQPGSAFKPLVYATALKQKYNPASIFYDLPTDFGKYKPNNFDGRFRGPVTMREALGQSLNIPAVKALALVGVKDAIKTAEDLGITSLDTPDKYGLSLVLGSAEVQPIEIAQAYGVFANGGVRQDISPILKIQDRKGKILEEFKPEDHKKQVLDAQVAYQMNNMMADQVAKAPVFGNLLAFRGRDVASKTGTTNGITNGQSDVRDAWTVGYVPSLVTAVWVGNNDHSPLGKGVLAANAAVPIFKSYMTTALRSLPNESFYRPEGIQTVTVDKLSNKLPSDASPPDQRITDVFASWQVPTKTDDIHVKVKLCKGTDLLATDETPASEVEEKYFVNVRSERPDDPAWEGPVRAWAEQQGFTNRPPTEKCDKFNADNRPTVGISKPTAGATFGAGMDIEASASSPFNISEVIFYVDNERIGSSTSAPYRMTYDVRLLSAGQHTLTAEAKDQVGRSTKVSTPFIVSKESTPPGNVNAVNPVPGRGNVLLTWINPSDSDLSRVRIYISEKPGELGLRYSTEISASPNQTGSATITGLTSGSTYHFTIRPVDSNNNENQSTKQTSGTAL